MHNTTVKILEMQTKQKKSFHVETDKMTVTNWRTIYLADSQSFVYLHIVKPKNKLQL